jgi:hypothetical protein
MSNFIRFYVENLVDQAISITPSTENALFPASNLQDHRRTKVFRSTTNSDNIVFDFGETSDINSIMIVDDPLNGFGVSTVTLELNGTNTWGAPAFSQALTFSTEHGVGYAEFSTQSYRFGRLVCTSSNSYIEIAQVFIGESVQIGPDRSPNYGWSYQNEDSSRITKNRYGQRFVDVIDRNKNVNMSFGLLTYEDMEDVYTILDHCGETKPFFMRLGCNSINVQDDRRFSGMFYLTSVPQVTNTSFNRYSLSFSLEEAK